MFQLSAEETQALRSQIVIPNVGRGGRRYLSYVLTEQGVAMLSTVLTNEQAIEVNIAIMRVFVSLRQMLQTNEELNRNFAVFDELRKLNEPPMAKSRRF